MHNDSRKKASCSNMYDLLEGKWNGVRGRGANIKTADEF